MYFNTIFILFYVIRTTGKATVPRFHVISYETEEVTGKGIGEITTNNDTRRNSGNEKIREKQAIYEVFRRRDMAKNTRNSRTIVKNTKTSRKAQSEKREKSAKRPIAEKYERTIRQLRFQ